MKRMEIWKQTAMEMGIDADALDRTHARIRGLFGSAWLDQEIPEDKIAEEKQAVRRSVTRVRDMEATIRMSN